MAGKISSKKEQRRAKLVERNASAEEKQKPHEEALSPPPPPPADTDDGEDSRFIKGSKKLPAEEFYKKLDGELNKVPQVGNAFDGIIRNSIRVTVPSFTRRLGALPSLRRKNLAWLQLLLADEQKTAQVKLYELGSRVALAKDDSDVVERSRKLFEDAAPYFTKDYGLWIFSRSLVRKRYNGLIDHDALNFASYEPVGNLNTIPKDLSSGIRCAEVFLFLAIDGDVPGDVLCSRDSVMAFLDGLNSEEGTQKIHAFAVVAGSVVETREKLRDVKGVHVAA